MGPRKEDLVEIITGYMTNESHNMAQTQHNNMRMVDVLQMFPKYPPNIEEVLETYSFRILTWPIKTNIELHKQGYDTRQKRRQYRADVCEQRVMLVTRKHLEKYRGRTQMGERTRVSSEENLEEMTIAKPFFITQIMEADPDSYKPVFVTIVDPDGRFDNAMTEEEQKMMSEEDNGEDDLTPDDEVTAYIQHLRRPIEDDEGTLMVEAD
ncbi:hypothetical protein QCA50_010839 [Cerrena zonata]|uniref:Uncharacterized protein n=1 Tax=Cerrena zonata TaxID=2478898 RepID=A0AAW0G7Q2_9APHY